MGRMIEASKYAHVPRIELDPDNDKNSVVKPIRPDKAFPVNEYRQLLATSQIDSSKLNKLAARTEVVEYFAHRYWVGNRKAWASETADEAVDALQEKEYQEAKEYLERFGYLAAKAVREIMIRKYSFTETDIAGMGDIKIVEAYFEAFGVPAFSMSDSKVAEELKRDREGGPIWEFIVDGNYARADYLMRKDVDARYPKRVQIPAEPLKQVSSSLTN